MKNMLEWWNKLKELWRQTAWKSLRGVREGLGESGHRQTGYLEHFSCVSPASRAAISAHISAMPIFRRPCFHEIKRHVIGPRVNSRADGTIHLAEKLFTTWKWPSERASHRESNHASPSLCVSIAGAWKGGRKADFSFWKSLSKPSRNNVSYKPHKKINPWPLWPYC